MTDKNKAAEGVENLQNQTHDLNSPPNLNSLDALDQYLKSTAGTRQGRAIPPLENWHPEQVADMNLVIKANGEWWHEGGLVTREPLVNLFATILWKEDNNGAGEYFLKTPVQKLRITVEDVPLLINDVGIINENDISWLEFTTTTGDVVRLDDEHPITLRTYQPSQATASNQINGEEVSSNEASSQEANSQKAHSKEAQNSATEPQVRPYMLVRNGLSALINRNTFYHLTEIGKLTENSGATFLTLTSGGDSYQISMPTA